MPNLQWIGKQDAIRFADTIPYRVLEEDESLSYGDKETDNLLIHGDNLDTLKALLPFYKGQVKCIYIDPPYNTQNAFSHYNDKLEHTIWLSLMYPRLKLLKKFLSPYGSIWISIDDDEGQYLKAMCDEIFNRQNFIASCIWQKIHSTKNDSKTISINHEYVLSYARDIEKCTINLLTRTDRMNSRYKNPDNDPRGPWQSGDLVANEERTGGYYDVIGPTGKVFNVPKGKHWVYSYENLKKLISENRIWFGKKGDSFPRKKRFLVEVQQGRKANSLWLSDEVGHNQEAKREVKRFNPDSIFQTPKPERLIHRILTLATQPGDLVLDSFLGSGTTAAVAQKMNRRWIGIEMEDTVYTHCVPRMKQVVDGEQGGVSKMLDWKGGGGYRYYRLGETIFDKDGQINKKVSFDTLASHIWFTETGKPWIKGSVSPLLGTHNQTAFYLLFNGILGDKTLNGGNVLSSKLLAKLPEFNGKKIIYGEASRLDEGSLKQLGIVFKQIPYNLKAR
jgi:adenine-specific DNA-methyltransferase